MTDSLVVLPDLQNRAAALGYATRAWWVFPVHSVINGACTCGRVCGRPGKHPRTMNGVKDATCDPDIVGKWWSDHPESNIGIACGSSRLLVVDVDPRNNGDETFSDLEISHGRLPATLSCCTGGGGQHYYFDVQAIDSDQKSRILGQGVELKGTGGYVVAPPSMHFSGKRYLWDAGQPEEVAFPPEWLTNQERRKSRYAEQVGEPIDSILGVAFSAAGLLGRPLGPDRTAVTCPWNNEHTSGSPGDSSTIVFGAHGKSKWGWFHCSHAHCQERLAGLVGKDRLHEVLRALPIEAAKIASTKIVGAERELRRVTRADWERSLQWDDKGRALLGTAGNLKLMMDNSQQWQGLLAFDESKDRIYWTRTPPEVSGMPNIEAGAPVGESDWIHVGHWFLKERDVRLEKSVTQDVIYAVARANTHNSLRQYLESIQWDGVQRISSWLHKYTGAEDTLYTQRVGRAWLISTMARAFDPGCQVDHTLVLEGPQGAGKTSVFRVLGGDWYLGHVPNLESKDAQHILGAAWIVELQELAAVRGGRLEAVKAYLTERWDRYRPPYARDFVKNPRRCVFGASTNEGEYIDDRTGARRFWPVRICKTGDIMIEQLIADRNQLLAEARDAYIDKERYYFTQEELGLTKAIIEEQSSRQMTDPWTDAILSFAISQHGNPFTTEEALVHSCAIAVGEMNMMEARRCGSILRAANYMRVRAMRMVHGSNQRTWVWMKKAGSLVGLAHGIGRTSTEEQGDLGVEPMEEPSVPLEPEGV